MSSFKDSDWHEKKDKFIFLNVAAQKQTPLLFSTKTLSILNMSDFSF